MSNLCFCPLLFGQSPSPTVAQFRASIQTVQTSAPQWRKKMNSVNVEDLPVAYATGKVYEQGKQVINQDLDVLLLWAGRVATSNSLYDEINYLSALQETQTQLQLQTSLLQDFSVPDKAMTARVQEWASSLSDLANGPLEEIFKTTFGYAIHHASEVQRACAK
jgi:hypothetical protein